jgi:penicillin-binding protein 2
LRAVRSRRPRETVRRERPIRTGRRDRPLIQTPSIALRVAIVASVAVALIGVILFRLWFLQILSGRDYVAEANDNRLRTVKVVAPRGVITDRNGKVLVDNRPGLAIGIRPMDVPRGQIRPLVDRIAKVMHMSARTIRRKLTDHAGVNWTQFKKGKGLQYDLVVLKDDVSKTLVSYVLEHQLSFPGVEVRKSYLRDYPQGDLAAHVLGTLSEISPQQLKQTQYRGYAAGDVIGQGGVESTYDKWLRGQDGTLKIEVNAAGTPKKNAPPIARRMPKPGDNLVLTIDSKVQRAAQNALLYGIQLAHASGKTSANGGAAVVLDAKTGAVIALASYPTFDPSVWVGGISEKNFRALQAPVANAPLLDRVDAGLYPVGSTFKIIDAVAALAEREITAATRFTCPGFFVPPNILVRTVFRCWSYPVGHGSLDLTQALVQSCDVYFYNVGELFYQRKDTALEDWAGRLSLGKLTGLDVPGELGGRVPTPAWRRTYFTNPVDKLWGPGQSINLSIGQGDLLATPLQMAVALATVANGGYVVQPHLGLKIVDPQGKLVRMIEPGAPKKLDVASSYLATIRNALYLAATSPTGTSYPVFGSYPIPVAGKTGTAQVFGKDDYAWYISYAPANDPKYVVAVMIEQGGHGGTAAAPAARMIYDALFDKRLSHVTGTTHSD